MSCASCHQASGAFQDGYERALARTRVLSRNTPTLLNVNRYTSYFWDGRASSLPEQVTGPLLNRHELNSSEKLLTQFTEATPELKKAWLQSEKPLLEFVPKALTDYMLSNATTSTKFDLYLRGKNAMSKRELAGWKLFSGKFRCVSCHALPNLTDNKFHDIGMSKRRLILQTNANPNEKDRFELGFDYGRANISDQAADLHAFRTPSLYNVWLTAPYMHNGTFQNLEEVLDFYSRKRQKSGLAAFSQAESTALLAFMKALTDARFANEKQMK